MVVRVSPKATRYRLQIRAAGRTWKTARTSQKRRIRLTLDPGRYRVRAQVKHRRWSPPGRASRWFTIPPDYARHLWVDPRGGDDAAAGTRVGPLRSVTEAWTRIRARDVSTAVHVLPGIAESPEYWENYSGAAVALFGGEFSNDINMYRVSNVTFDGVRIHRAGDVFHCERCENITLRRVDFDGQGAAHETIKVNQSSSHHDPRLEDHRQLRQRDRLRRGAARTDRRQPTSPTAPPLTRPPTGVPTSKEAVLTSRSANNRIHHCGTGGFSAGQGTGFEFMVAPWLHYEADGRHVLRQRHPRHRRRRARGQRWAPHP